MAAPGDLLEARELAPDVAGSRAWWVRVASEDLAGRPTTTTGVVAAPAAPGRDRPVVAWCHGTTGLGDAAVPSAQPAPAGELVTFPEPVGPDDVDRGVPGMADYLAAGAVVVAPDYQGLGTEGFHHYCVHATGARDAVAMVRAAQRLDGAGTGRRVGALGWSEGGGMALGVAELPGAALDGLDLRAVATYAPGVPALVLDQFWDEVLAAGRAGDPHVLMLLAVHGWLFDDLDPGDLLSPAAAALLGEVWNDLPVHLVERRAVDLAATGPLLRDDPLGQERWSAAMRSASAGTACPQVPVLVATGLADTTVFPAWQAVYVDSARALGGHVEVVERPDEDHCEVPFTAHGAAAEFLLDLLGA